MIKYFSILLLTTYYLLLTPAFAAIGPEPDPNAPTDYTPPRLISNVALVSDGSKVVITWNDPLDNDFHRVEVLRNDGTGTAITGVVRGRVQVGIQRYEDLDVISSQHYKYQFRLLDVNFNTSITDEYGVTVAAPAPIQEEPAEESQEQQDPSPLPAQAGQPSLTEGEGVVEEPPLFERVRQDEGLTNPSQLGTLLARFSLIRDEDAEAQYRQFLVRDMAEFSIISTAAYETATVNFIVYGISGNTRRLGAGERRALTRDYYETVGRGNIIWEDMERMTSGEKPLGRNLEREQEQLPRVLSAWVKIMGRNPNFQNPSEDLAWNTMMYRVRFGRDLTRERVGIAKFRDMFNATPVSPLDWAVVRALGYVL